MHPVVASANDAADPTDDIIDVVNTEPIQEELQLKLGLHWQDYALVTVWYLKELMKDAEGYTLAAETLEAAQEELEERTDMLNMTRREKHQSDIQVYDLKKRIMELEDVDFWETGWFWGVVGLAGGVLVSFVIFAGTR
jgi:hypothetical protein